MEDISHYDTIRIEGRFPLKTERNSTRKTGLTVAEYRKLSELRFQLRRFIHSSEENARSRGLEPQHHQTLLAIKGLPEGMAPTIANLAHRMQLAHHSMVELIDRITEKGLVVRKRSVIDRRRTSVHLTRKGERILEDLSELTYEQLQTSFVDLLDSLRNIIEGDSLQLSVMQQQSKREASTENR